MPDKLHRLFDPADGIHCVHAWLYDTLVERDAASYVAADLGRVAWVLDTNSFYALTYEGGGEGDPAVWVQLSPSNRFDLNPQTGTTYTLVDAVSGLLTTLSNASGITVTVPGTLAVGSIFPICMLGAGQATFVGSAGLTLQPPPGLALKSRGQYARLTVEILSPTLGVLSGDVAVS